MLRHRNVISMVSIYKTDTYAYKNCLYAAGILVYDIEDKVLQTEDNKGGETVC